MKKHLSFLEGTVAAVSDSVLQKHLVVCFSSFILVTSVCVIALGVLISWQQEDFVDTSIKHEIIVDGRNNLPYLGQEELKVTGVENRMNHTSRRLLSINGPGPVYQYRPTDTRVWSIAVGHDYGLHEYIDSEGYHRGFTLKLIRRVCQLAGINCRTVRDAYTNCWVTQPGQMQVGGFGLMSGYYDGCANWVQLRSRKHVLKYSQPWLQRHYVYLYKKKGGNDLNLNDLYNNAFGVMDGWAANEFCLYRYLKTEDTEDKIPTMKSFVENARHYKVTSAAVDALTSGLVKALWMSETAMSFALDRVEKVKNGAYRSYCSLAGSSIMMRKDNGLDRLWNIGFNKLLDSGEYSTMCRDENKANAGADQLNCL